MSERQLFLLSPYRPPTSYPVSLSAEEAGAWLNAYAALWHPAALTKAILPPAPASAYDHSDPLPAAIYALPAGPSLFLAEDWKTKAGEANAAFFEATADRDATMRNLLHALRNEKQYDSETVRLFTGLGYGHLMLDTLFDASNHDRLLELEAFWRTVQEAVEVIDDAVAVREKLTEAAKMLQVAREGLSNAGVTLADLIVLTNENIAAGFPSKLGDRPVTIMSTSQTLRKFTAEQFSELKASAAVLAVGVVLERDDVLLPVESQIWSIRQAREDVTALTGAPPKLYARQQSEYHPQLPSWLNQLGFRGMLAMNMDGATVPTRYYSVIQWPGPDGKAINAFTRDAHHSHDTATFFNFAYYLHDAQNRESSPTFLIQHSAKPHIAYDDLLALCELAPVFGTWSGLDALTADSHSAEYVSVPGADEFFCDSLDDRVTKRNLSKPVSGLADHARHRRKLDSAYTFAALHHMLTPVNDLDRAEHQKLDQAETWFESSGDGSFLHDLEDHWASKLADRLLARSEPEKPGFLVLNASAATRRVGLELALSDPIPVDGPVKASEFSNGKANVVVEVPGLGFAWIPRGVRGTVLPKARMKTAEGATVRNEYIEAEFDVNTGAIRAIRDGKMRITRFGQMLVWNPGSRMVAKDVSVTAAGSVVGEVTARGTIVDDNNKPLANFTQILRTWMGRPALEIKIVLEPLVKPQGFAWHDFFGCRFAWRDDRATLFRGVNGMNSLTHSNRPQSPDYLEIRFGKERNFLFTGGLPFLQKKDGRMIDIVLAPQGETATSFDLMIAFERDYPMAMAQSWLTPTPVIPVSKGPPPVGASGWLANIDMPSLLLTSLRPSTPSEGMNRAVTARFTESSGFAVSGELRFARDPAKVSSVDLNGDANMPLSMTGDGVPVDCSSSELYSVKCEWA